MVRIAESEIDRLKAEVSLVRLIEGAGYTLTAQGKDVAMRCPLHEGDETPSFIVTPTKNVWHCFGCQQGGSVIDWVMAVRKVSFRHAVELLRQDHASLFTAIAEPAVSEVAAIAARPAADLASGVSDAGLLTSVIAHYHATLLQSPEALAYLATRGLDHPDLIDHFRLGFANRTLGYRLPRSDYRAGPPVRAQLQRLGILRDSGHEHFNGSLVIPVFDEVGNVAEIYGRKVRTTGMAASTPKHLYLPGPHRGVFNLDGWRGSQVASGILPHAPLPHPCGSDVILCEALIDALTFWCAGYRHVTSAFGVSGFTDELLQALVTHGVKRVLIAYDRDEPGDIAAAKLAPLLAAHGIAAYRVLFPKGMDANEFALKVGPAAKALGLVLRQAERIGPSAAPLPCAVAVPTAPKSVQHDPVSPATASARESLPVPDVLPLAAAVDADALAAPLLAAEGTIEVRDHDVIATFGPRRYRVRGLMKNLSYEVLKVNVQASMGEHLHVDTLDLYQAKTRAGFIKQAGIELGIAEAVIGRDVIALLRALEPLQEAAITQTLQPTAAALPPLSADEETAALALLRDPRLSERIVADTQALGVVGEASNVLMGYLACVSRKLDKPLAILIQSTSAAGKSTLMDALLSLMPDAERVHYSAMTGQSLFYLGEGDLKHKILAIAEEEGVRQAAYALKLLQSQGELTIASTGKDPTSGKLVTEEYRVEGPVMLFLTTTAIDIDEELLNRCLVLTIDESREQTAAIQARQRSGRTLDGLLAGAQSEVVRRTHRAAQTLLRPLAVVNPFAEQLTFRTESTRLRRDHAKYLTMIDSIALLYQHQRTIQRVENGGQTIEYVEVTLDDIALANRLAHEVLGRSLDELPPQTRRVLDALDALVRERMQTHALARADVRFTRAQARQACGLTDTALRVHLDRLIAMDTVLVHRGGFGSRFEYELAFEGEVSASATQFIGLLDVGALRLPTQTLQATESSLQGKQAKLASPLHPENTPLAPGLQGQEIPRIASADAAFSLVAASALPDARHRSRRAKSSYTATALNGGAIVAEH